MPSSLRVAMLTMGLLACAPTHADCFDDEEDCSQECEDSFDEDACVESCTSVRNDCLAEADARERRKEVTEGVFDVLGILFGDDE